MAATDSSMRWLYALPKIPLFLAGILLAAFLYSWTGQVETPVIRAQQVTLAQGQTSTFAPIKLDPSKRYTLKMSLTRDRKQLNSWASVGATLTNTETEEEIFELSDDYWAEWGTWHEDGESGTWEEQNADTTFHFRVGEPGEYQLQVAHVEHASRPNVSMRVSVVSRNPVVLHWLVLLGGIGVLLLISLVARARRRTTLFAYLEKMTPGGVVQVQGVRYTVVERWLHKDDEGGKPGYEWRLRAADGAERYLALETYEYESGDEDYLGRYLLIDRPDEVVDHGDRYTQTVHVDGRTYRYDPENSGRATMIAYLDGEAYETRYFARVFHDGNGCPGPSLRGVQMVEHTRFAESGEEEWCVMEILGWKDIEALELGPAAAA